MDRKREAAKQRKKNLEEQHAGAINRKEQNDMEAAEKNRDAGEVEAEVSIIFLRLLVRSVVMSSAWEP